MCNFTAGSPGLELSRPLRLSQLGHLLPLGDPRGRNYRVGALGVLWEQRDWAG